MDLYSFLRFSIALMNMTILVIDAAMALHYVSEVRLNVALFITDRVPRRKTVMTPSRRLTDMWSFQTYSNI